jgi:hypothetical protein
MTKHYPWQRQPIWPTAIVLLVGVELGLALALAIGLLWKALAA